MTKLRLPANYAQLTRSQKLAIRSKGNLARASDPVNTYLRRRVLLDPRDRACVLVGQRMAQALIVDKGGSEHATAGELALIENAMLSRILALICLREVSEKGAFLDTESGRVASAALQQLPKFIAAERGALQALGTSRRTAPALSLGDYLKAKAEGQEPASIPAEVGTDANR